MTTAVWDEGTKNRTADQIADELSGLGATIAFSAGWDSTSAQLFSLKSRLPKTLEIYADLLLNPLFPEKEMEREKKMMLGRFIQVRNEPTMLAQLAIGPTLYGVENPYGKSPLGTPDSIKSIVQRDLVSFFEEKYVPNGATLIAVGDITTEELVKELETIFAGWRSDSRFRRSGFFGLPWPKPTRILLIDKPGAAQSVISVAQLSAERNTPDYYALNVMNSIFGGQFMSRLNMNLREDEGLHLRRPLFVRLARSCPGRVCLASSSVQDRR